MLVKVLDGQPWGPPNRHIHVVDVAIGSIFITHREQVEMLVICFEYALKMQEFLQDTLFRPMLVAKTLELHHLRDLGR